MSGNNRKIRFGQVAIDYVKVGSADSAGKNPNQYLSLGWKGIG
jgi:hypothetical protein